MAYTTIFLKISLVIFSFLQFRGKYNFLEHKIMYASVIHILFALYTGISLMMNCHMHVLAINVGQYQQTLWREHVNNWSMLPCIPNWDLYLLLVLHEGWSSGLSRTLFQSNINEEYNWPPAFSNKKR